MSESHDRIDELLGNVLSDAVPDHVNQRLRSQMADFRLKLAERHSRRSKSSIAFRRRMLIGSVAAAAMLLVAISILWVLRPQASFADVIAAVQRLPWIHVSITNPDGKKREVWYSAKDDVSASRSKDWIEYYDHKLKVYYSYDVGEEVLYRVPEHTPRRANEYALIAEALRLVLGGNRPTEKPFKNLEFLGQEGSNMELLDQTLNRVDESGHQWFDCRLTVRHSKVPGPITLLFRVDPKTMLPHTCRMEGKWEKKLVSTEQQIDYPERGPTSVYELGVPQTAKLIDRVPSDDIVRVLDTMRASRQRMDDYRAIVVDRMEDADYEWWNSDFPMMLYRKGDKTRADFARWTGDYPYIDKPADGEDMEKWWRKRAQDFKFCPIYITHGPRSFYIKTGVTTDANGANKLVVQTVEKRDTNQIPGETFPPYYSRSPEFVCRPPLGIPQQVFEPIIETAPADGPKDSVLLRVAKSGRMPGATDPNPKNFPRQADIYRFWLDPKRDYAALRWDMVGMSDTGNEEILGSYIIEELKQSPRGIWFATRFRVKAVPPVAHDQIFNIYVDFDVKLPDSLFEPPVVGQEFR